MKCTKCENKAVYAPKHTSENLCKNHFMNYFEKKVNKTFRKYKLITPGDNVGVAVSGGKDSCTALYLTKKFCNKIGLEPPTAIVIDEGIKGYRDVTIKDLKKFCKEQDVKLVIKTYKKEQGKTLDEFIEIAEKKKVPLQACSICGVFRRYDLNKAANELGLTKLVTGHNLDDEIQTFMIDIMRGDIQRIARLGPMTGVKDRKGFVQRVKPLYLMTEKEVALYTHLKGFPITDIDCPKSTDNYRFQIRDWLNEMETKHPSTKHIMMSSQMKLIDITGEHYEKKGNKLRKCDDCGELSVGPTCKACQIKELLL